jgi:lysophospholipase
MENWKNGHLQMVEGAEHEILMETPALRDAAIDDITRLFLGNAKS